MAVDTATTLRTIADVYAATGRIVDPHTAVGIAAARQAAPPAPAHAPICIAAAHPAKFPQAIQDAIGHPAEHPALQSLNPAAARRTVLPADINAVREYVSAHAL